jgi:ArsR family transcriptional regulator
MVQVRKTPSAKYTSRRDKSALKGPPSTPRAAAMCRRPVDGLLDPALFKVLGDPTRVQLLACLMKCGRACLVGEVAACCAVDLSVVSRHLKALAQEGVVESSREGRMVSYRVCYEQLAKRLRDLAMAIEECAPPSGARDSKKSARSSRSMRACDGGQNGCC